MADNNSLHTVKMSIIRSWGEQDLLQWLDKRHIEKYTLLNFSQKLLHEKKIQQLSFYLPNFSRSFQHWVYFVDFFPYATTSCKRPPRLDLLDGRLCKVPLYTNLALCRLPSEYAPIKSSFASVQGVCALRLQSVRQSVFLAKSDQHELCGEML